jgi:hypothetical protein
VCELALRLLGYEPIYRVYSHPEILWRDDDLLGWSHQPGTRATYVGPRPWPVEFEGSVEINSLGLRGPELGERPPNALRVMLLGDSMVAGFEVPYEATFGALLERKLRAEFDFPIEVVNAAVRGYGTDQSYLYFKERGHRLAPDLVVFLHGGNDPADNVTLHRMRRTFGKGGLALRSDGSLELVGHPIPHYPLCAEWLLDANFRPRRVDTALESAFCRVQTQLADRSALFTFFSLRVQQNPGMLMRLYSLGSPSGGAERALSAEDADRDLAGKDIAPQRELTAAILRALAREVRARGAGLVHIVIPSFWPDFEPESFVADGVSLAFVRDDLDRDDLHYVHDSHLNERGHALVAERIEPEISARIRAARSLAPRGADAQAGD